MKFLSTEIFAKDNMTVDFHMAYTNNETQQLAVHESNGSGTILAVSVG